MLWTTQTVRLITVCRAREVSCETALQMEATKATTIETALPHTDDHKFFFLSYCFIEIDEWN